MNKRKFYFIAVTGLLLMNVLVCISCGTEKKDEPAEVKTPINISVFLDLSDRLDSTCNGGFPVSQMTRDTAVVNALVDYFVTTCVEHKISENKNRFQILFHPTPKTSDIMSLAANLNIDMAKISNPADKKKKLVAMKDEFSKSLTQIYEQTLRDKKWIGSDIWGFFCNKNAKVDNLCIREGYRNIMVILTDGYIYHKDNMQQDGSSYSYILPSLVNNVPDLSLMAPRTGLDSLEVMILEINPGKPLMQSKLISVLETWLKDMGVKRYVVSETGMPSDTRTIIDNFLQGE
ncbi:MAG: hypothetical protein LUD00_09850 [Prevotellaceae bacterium]|nr:hypothetical protein [Prevotellaceae bacterium]